MTWEEEHNKRVSQFPPEIKHAHDKCRNHREQILTSNICGCFYCLEIFKPSEIEEWTDEDEQGIGTTALCPYCYIDSVIGSGSGIEITKQFLERMNRALE